MIKIDIVIKHVQNKNISTDQKFDWREIPKEEYKNEIVHKARILHNSHEKTGNMYKEIVKSRKWWRTKLGEDISRFVKRCET